MDLALTHLAALLQTRFVMRTYFDAIICKTIRYVEHNNFYYAGILPSNVSGFFLYL